MKFKIAISIIIVLVVGVIYFGFKYFDAVLLVNDMQSGIDYKNRQILTLKSLFISATEETDRFSVVQSIEKNFKNNAVIKKFDDRLEVNEIVIIFDKKKIKKIVTINEYTIGEY